MKIETKFNVGDEVWVILEGKAVEGVVREYSFNAYDNYTEQYYKVKETGSCNICKININNLFATKQELLESL